MFNLLKIISVFFFITSIAFATPNYYETDHIKRWIKHYGVIDQDTLVVLDWNNSVVATVESTKSAPAHYIDVYGLQAFITELLEKGACVVILTASQGLLEKDSYWQELVNIVGEENLKKASKHFVEIDLVLDDKEITSTTKEDYTISSKKPYWQRASVFFTNNGKIEKSNRASKVDILAQIISEISEVNKVSRVYFFDDQEENFPSRYLLLEETDLKNFPKVELNCIKVTVEKQLARFQINLIMENLSKKDPEKVKEIRKKLIQAKQNGECLFDRLSWLQEQSGL